MNEVDVKKSIVAAMVEKLVNNIKKELGHQKELADDSMAMKKVEEMKENVDPLPENCGYTNYVEWITALEKEISSGFGSLAKIQEQKVELEALQYYLDNVS